MLEMKRMNRKIIVAVCVVFLVGIFYSLRSTTTTSPAVFDTGKAPPPPPNTGKYKGKVPERVTAQQKTRQAEIIDAFQHAWDGYSEYCFGRDTLHPVSNTCEDDFGGYGATAIDSLPTAIMFEKEGAVLQILHYITNDLDFKVVKSGTRIQVFEVAIRHFAGMISAWDLLNGPFKHLAKDPVLRQGLYDQMVNLGDILSHAFNTPSGIPLGWLNPATGETDKGSSNTIAGVGTIILEFARLSDITKNKTYVKLAERAEDYLLNPKPSSHEPYPGLLGSFVSANNGELMDSRGSWGAFADSYYEYLIKAYIYDRNRYGFYLERWLAAADSTITHIGSHPYGHPEWTLLSSWNGDTLHQSMESLSWFAGGNFILGGMVTDNQTLVDYGLSIADAAGAIYAMTATGLGPEFVTWTIDCDADACDPATSIQIADGKYRLRPEVLETWYHAYRATRNPKYRAWAWAAFTAINTHCRTASGFSAIADVNAVDGGGKTDVQESFVFAEVMKYVYLIHREDDDTPFHVQDSRTGTKNTWVFNTEAHPLRIAGPPT